MKLFTAKLLVGTTLILGSVACNAKVKPETAKVEVKSVSQSVNASQLTLEEQTMLKGWAQQREELWQWINAQPKVVEHRTELLNWAKKVIEAHGWEKTMGFDVANIKFVPREEKK